MRLAAIVLGVLPLIALTFPLDVWGQCNTFLRTRSRHLPSERTVKDVVAQMVLEDFLAVAPSGTMQEMRARCLEDGNAVSDTRSSTEKKIA